MSKMKKIAAMTAALLICASTMGYLPQDSIKISNVTANAAEEEITSVEINEINFPDETFRIFIRETFDNDDDGVLSAEEIAAVTSIILSEYGMHGITTVVSDLKGIEYFTNLVELNCNGSNLTKIDLSKNLKLEDLSCNNNGLTSLDVSNNKNLRYLSCYGNMITELDLTNNTELESLSCGYSNFWSSGGNQLTELDLSKNTKLDTLMCDNNKLTQLDLSNNKSLYTLSCCFNKLTNLDLSNNVVLYNLSCSNNNLTTLTLNTETELNTLNCAYNEFTSFALSSPLQSEESSIAPFEGNIYEITLTDNTFDLSTLPTGFDISKASDWTNATVEGNILIVEDALKPITYRYNCGYDTYTTFTLISSDELPEGSVQIHANTFPDNMFRYYITNFLDTDKNNVLSAEEIAAITELNIEACGISDLTGIEYFENLKVLACDYNNIRELDLSQNKALEELYCGENFSIENINVSNNKALKVLYCGCNRFTSLDLSNNTALEELYCCGNSLTTLNLSNNTALEKLDCSCTELATLDLSKNTALEELDCYENQLTSLDVSNCSALTDLSCWGNQLTSLDVSNNTALIELNCYHNQLTSLDLSKNTALTELSCYNNQLTYLDVSKNTALTRLFCYNNQLTSLDISKNTALHVLWCHGNTYEINLINNTFDLSTLPTGFDVTKASDWTNGTVKGNILTVEDTSKSITYKYDLGNGHSETFTLVTQIEETPAETTTTPAAPETTTTTTTTTTPETITTTTTTTNIESDSTTNTTTSTTYTPAATSTTAKPIPTPIETYGTCGAQGSNVTWTYDGNGTLTISGEGKMSNWSSEESPWFNKQEIETIIIEDGITNIGSFAFRYCHSLTSITIPESVTSIDYGAFNFCDSLASITIPESVTDISPSAFSGSKWFKTQQEKNLFVIVNGILIDGTACKGDVVIPDSVKTINEEAFERCYDLTEITIPESVTSIGKDAFNHCDSLNKITIKNPDCEIYDAATTICDGYYFSRFYYFTGKIYGYKNSTAQAYAEKYNIRFVAIDETPAETTTTATTTAPEITTTTTTTTAEEEITSVEINETNFPDYLLRYYITKYIDTDTDNILSAEEIADVTKLDISVGGIRELTGIHHFKNLEDLDCSGNKLTTIDISNFTALTRLDCGKNKLTSLDVSNNSALETLWCMANQLTSLDLSNNTALAYLSCSDNQLTSLDLSNNTALAYLYCYDNQLTSLDLSNNTALTELDCGKNQFTSLDVSNNTALTRLECYYNQLTSLDVSNNTALIRLVCYENQLTSIDVSHCSALTYLGCSNNQLTSLDVSNTKMQSTSAYQNEYEIALIGNTFDLSTLPTGFDVSKASNWTNATVKGNILTVEDITKEVTYKYDCGNRNSEKFTLIPQIEETPAETTTTTAAPETTITTTATTTVTTTPATTTPEEDLPQTGFSKLYNCIPVSAGALVLLGMYAVKKSRKEDEEE